MYTHSKRVALFCTCAPRSGLPIHLNSRHGAGWRPRPKSEHCPNLGTGRGEEPRQGELWTAYQAIKAGGSSEAGIQLTTVQIPAPRSVAAASSCRLP